MTTSDQNWWQAAPGERCFYCGQIAGASNVCAGHPRDRVFDELMRRMQMARDRHGVHLWPVTIPQMLDEMKPAELVEIARSALGRVLVRWHGADDDDDFRRCIKGAASHIDAAREYVRLPSFPDPEPTIKHDDALFELAGYEFWVSRTSYPIVKIVRRGSVTWSFHVPLATLRDFVDLVDDKELERSDPETWAPIPDVHVAVSPEAVDEVLRSDPREQPVVEVEVGGEPGEIGCVETGAGSMTVERLPRRNTKDDNRRAGEPNPSCPMCSVASGTICRACAVADAYKFETLYHRALRRRDGKPTRADLVAELNMLLIQLQDGMYLHKNIGINPDHQLLLIRAMWARLTGLLNYLYTGLLNYLYPVQKE